MTRVGLMRERIRNGLDDKVGHQLGAGVLACVAETSLRVHPFWGRTTKWSVPWFFLLNNVAKGVETKSRFYL